MNALQRRRHLTWVLIPEKRKEKSVQRNITLKKQRSKRANKVWNTKKTTEASEQNRRTCISLKNCTSSLFLSNREVRSHSSLDSVGRAGSRPPAIPAQGWGVCLYALQGFVWVLGCLEWKMDAICLSRGTSQPWDTAIPFMWATEKDVTPLHKVGNLLSKVLTFLKKKKLNLQTPLHLRGIFKM